MTGADAVLTGRSTGYSVTATMADGTTRAVTPAWTSSHPEVGSVDNAGRFDGKAHGTTTLTATFESRTVSRTVQVVNDYEGTWTGKFVIRACIDTTELTDSEDGGWCASHQRVGSVYEITITLSQGGRNLDEIMRTVDARSNPHAPDPITGVVNADGRLTLAATTWNITDFDYHDIVLFVERVSPMELSLDNAGGMTGRWSADIAEPGRKGTVHTEVELVTMTRAK